MPLDIPVKNEIKELRLLFEVSRLLDDMGDLPRHLEEILALTASFTRMERGAVAILDPDGLNISLTASIGLKPGEVGGGPGRIGEGIVGRVVESGRPVLVPRATREPMFLNRLATKALPKDSLSFISVPIKIGPKTIGALSADPLFPPSVPMDDDLRLLAILASLIAQAIKARQDIKSERENIMAENLRLQEMLEINFQPQTMVGSSPRLKQVFSLIAQVAPTNLTVLIQGESGTGKELVADNIHLNSQRADRPLIKVNCSALPENLVESELFGHEKGAFTGAMSLHKGRFELADGGTLFLDEVGDLPAAAQVKLLRALQEKKFERVGGTETLTTDVRLVAATNRDLADMVSKGIFREDLYYRLNVFSITMPPLRERLEDVPFLAEYFLGYWGREVSKKLLGFTPNAMATMRLYHWPGNVRELSNVLARAVILTEDGLIHRRHLPSTAPAGKTPETMSLPAALDDLEKRMITQALKFNRGNMSKAAETLGISERIMGLRMKKFKMDFKHFRGGKKK